MRIKPISDPFELMFNCTYCIKIQYTILPFSLKTMALGLANNFNF